MGKIDKNECIDDDWMDDDDEDSQKDKYLIFHLGEEDYGLEIAYVIDIVGLQKITKIPDMDDYVKGVINLRGQVIPVIDVRARFHLPERDYDDRTCVVVVKILETSIGLVVDTVMEVRDIMPDDISDPPKVAKGTSHRYILGLGKVGEEVKILLDANKLLFAEELAELRQTVEEKAESETLSEDQSVNI